MSEQELNRIEGSQRVEDIDKARFMAESAAGAREQAAIGRRVVKLLSKTGDVKDAKLAEFESATAQELDERADIVEEIAGTEYDAKEKDPERAHAMALAGNEARSFAATMRKKDRLEMEQSKHYKPLTHEDSIAADEIAKKAEEEAGRQYNSEKSISSKTDN